MLMHAIVLTALLPAVLAYSETVPVVAWSSDSTYILDGLPSKLSHAASVIETILSKDGVCDNDAIILVEQPGLHASDLRTLSPFSLLAKALSSAPSSRQFPYVKTMSSAPFTGLAESISRRCNSRLVNLSLGENPESGYKHVVCVNMPHAEGYGADRKIAMADHTNRLSEGLQSITAIFPKHLIIYAGSPSPGTFLKRQILPPGNSTLTEGGILKRYQLLTPALITTLLVTFFIIVPVIMVGVSALSSIQSPLRVESAKGFNARDKKNN